jgi:hypothetical protein
MTKFSTLKVETCKKTIAIYDHKKIIKNFGFRDLDFRFPVIVNNFNMLLTGVGKQRCKVSSTLNASSQYASKHMFDLDGSKCWNSDQVFIDFFDCLLITTIRGLHNGF